MVFLTYKFSAGVVSI